MKVVRAYLHSVSDQVKLIPAGQLLLLVSFALVAFSNSPMPQKVTWLEILIGSGLVAGGFFLSSRIYRAIPERQYGPQLMVLVTLLLSVPLGVGMYYNNNIADIFRDVIPLLFLMGVPIMLTCPAERKGLVVMRNLLVCALIFVGAVSILQFFKGITEYAGSPEHMRIIIQGGTTQFMDKTLPGATKHAVENIEKNSTERNSINSIEGAILKAYDPAVLFTALFLGSWAVLYIVKGGAWFAAGVALLTISVGVVYGFAIIGLRAHSAFYLLLLTYIAFTQMKERGFYVRLIPFMGIILVLLWPQIAASFTLLLTKHIAVGTNGKFEEWSAVITTIFSSPQRALLGIGWGGLFDNPILREPTRFTHSMLSFFLLKSGILGVIGMCLAIFLLAFGSKQGGYLSRMPLQQKILLFSSMPPLIIGILFQPTYKMLSFGVVLALFVLTLSRMDQELP